MPADVSLVSGIAGRYATALFELAHERDALDAVAGDLESVAAMIDESADLTRLLRSPVIGREEQGQALDAVLQRAEVGELTRKFVGVVAENRRLFALRDMCKAYRGLMAEHRGEVVAEVTTAHALNDSQMLAVRSELSAAMRTEVNLENRVDDDIIGGMIVRVGSRMVDASLRTKLQNLRIAMRGVE